ncbi:Halomucin, partial [Frankliniella fusca]
NQKAQRSIRRGKRRKKQESDSDSDSAEGCDDIIQEENESDSDSDSAEGCDDIIQEENESDSDSDSAEGYNDLIHDSDSDNAEGCDDPTEGENDHGEVNLNEGNGNSEPEPSEPSSPENSDSGSDDEDNFDLNDELLNQRLELAGNSTVRDALAVLLSVTVRFKLPLVALEALLKGHNTLLGYRALPHDKSKLWKVLKRNSLGIVKYAYCPHTTASLGLYDALPDHVVCEHCEKTHRKREVKYFEAFSTSVTHLQVFQFPVPHAAVKHLHLYD